MLIFDALSLYFKFEFIRSIFGLIKMAEFQKLFTLNQITQIQISWTFSKLMKTEVP